MIKNNYKQLSAENLEHHLSNYLVPHLSYSSIETFSRNPLNFEMSYIFNIRSKQSSFASTLWKIYHSVLEKYFNEKMNWKIITKEEMLTFWFKIIDEKDSTEFKLWKEYWVEWWDEIFRSDLYPKLTALIWFFLDEYENWYWEVNIILGTEVQLKDFVDLETIDDEVIPLPLKCFSDLIFIDSKWYLQVKDHKSTKWKYITDTENLFVNSVQTTTNVLLINSWIKNLDQNILELSELEKWGSINAIEKNQLEFFEKLKRYSKKFPKILEWVKQMSFVYNKASVNTNWNDQVQDFSLVMEKVLPIQEAMFMEKIEVILKAVQDPMFNYVLNASDNLCDKEALASFWINKYTWNLDLSEIKNQDLRNKFKEIWEKNWKIKKLLTDEWVKSFFEENNLKNKKIDMEKLTITEKLEMTLKILNCGWKVYKTIKWPSCTTYLVEQGLWVSIQKIKRKPDDIASALWVTSVRILNKLIVKDWKAYIWIEANNLEKNTEKFPIEKLDWFNFALWKDNFWEVLQWDISEPSTPHLLLSWATGSWKSVWITSLIRQAEDKKIPVTIIDPKREFLDFAKKHKVINEQNEIEEYFEYKVLEMEEIFKKHWAKWNSENKQLIIFDEYSDCYSNRTKTRKINVPDWFTAKWMPKFKKVKDESFKALPDNVLILAQKARSAWMNLVLSSQRFSVAILSWDVKANFATRICFTVASNKDSMVMLDEIWAEDLNWNWDFLLQSPWNPIVRWQWFYSE